MPTLQYQTCLILCFILSMSDEIKLDFVFNFSLCDCLHMLIITLIVLLPLVR